MLTNQEAPAGQTVRARIEDSVLSVLTTFEGKAIVIILSVLKQLFFRLRMSYEYYEHEEEEEEVEEQDIFDDTSMFRVGTRHS